MDSRTALFLSLVDCSPEEVRDTPADGSYSDRIAEIDERIAENRERRIAVASSIRNVERTTLKFGKHKGKRLKDVPTWYLRWLSEQAWIEPELMGPVRVLLSQRKG